MIDMSQVETYNRTEPPTPISGGKRAYPPRDLSQRKILPIESDDLRRIFNLNKLPLKK